TVGTAAALQTDYAVYGSSFVTGRATPATADDSTWSTAHSPAGNFNFANGTTGTTLTATRNVNTLLHSGGAETLTLTGSANLGTFGILNGGSGVFTIAATGGGVLTLPTTSAGQLYVTTGSGGITVGAAVTNNTGALSLVKSGTAGNLILNGVNSYTGDTTVNAGTLQIGTNGVATGAKLGGTTGVYAGRIFLAAGATLHVQTDAAQTLSGVISGDGNLIKANVGTLVLSGANTFTGKTSLTPITTGGSGTLSVSSFNSVNGGSPLLASSSLGAPTTVANGTIDFGVGSIQGGGTLAYTGPGETTDRVINFIFNGNGAGKTLDASGTGPLKFTSTFTASGSVNNDITLQGTGSGEIVGGLPFAFRNFTKSGTGTWTLGGTVGGTGSVAVSAGRLLVNNAFSSTESGTGTGAVSITATLGGTGQIAPGSANAVTVGSNGTLAPGNGGIGTLTVNSANTTAVAVLAFTGTGKLLMELGPGLTADRVRITGAAAGDVSFSNTAVNFTDLTAGGLTPGVYTLMTADAAGAYAGLTTNPDGTIATGLTIGTGLTAYPGSTLSVSGNDIVLNVVPEPGAASLAALAFAGLLSRRRRTRGRP
ncbi:MAG TPA: autotransporter-associated beta strand repeat-containing protein, partial [Humisphaera sp.]